ncbi:MAG: N-acyl-D-amino-acid deacylase family protein [Elsteraceae bacterium]
MIAADLLITDALLYSGDATPPVKGGLAVKGDRIVAVGDCAEVQAAQRLDARGMALAPGFIDAHTHDDRVLITHPEMRPKISQGVTTVIAGNCGVSLAPLAPDAQPPQPLSLLGDLPYWRYGRFKDYFAALDAGPATINSACLAGHMTLRHRVMDRTDRPATDAEIAEMSALLDEALADGALGLSTGLFYPLGIEAKTSEVIELAKVARRHGAMYVTHMRNEAEGVMDSLAETFEIGRAADLPVVVSHHKVAGKLQHGRTAETLPYIDQARRSQPIGLDVYPYAAASTMLAAGRLAIADRVLVTYSTPVPEAAGRDLHELAAEWGVTPEAAVERLTPAGAVYFMMSEDDVERILAFEGSMVGSDGIQSDGGKPHPRLWGTFPRVLGHYSRDRRLFPLETAVHKMTGLTADNFGLKDRGRLRVGAFADLTLFDPATVIDRATYEEPELAAAGILQVWVNGQSVWREGKATGARPGRALRRQELSAPLGAWRPSETTPSF